MAALDASPPPPVAASPTLDSSAPLPEPDASDVDAPGPSSPSPSPPEPTPSSGPVSTSNGSGGVVVRTVVTFTRFWKGISLPHIGDSTPAHSSTPTQLSHSSRTLLAVLSGGTVGTPPPADKPAKEELDAPKEPAKDTPARRKRSLDPRADSPDKPSTLVPPVPNVSRKQFKRLKHDLLRQRDAVKIVQDIKKVEAPIGAHAGRAYALPVLPPEGSAPVDHDQPAFTVLSSIPTSSGGLAGLAGAKAGAFDLAAGVTGAMLWQLDQAAGMFAPLDRVGVFTWWWGYELSLPPPVLRTLASYHSVSTTMFTFFQAFIVAGGAPELAPFVKYLSSYVDFEYSAIKSSNKGQGVVLAATWLLPVALVPRPWDFPLSSSSPSSPVPPPSLQTFAIEANQTTVEVTSDEVEVTLVAESTTEA